MHFTKKHCKHRSIKLFLMGFIALLSAGVYLFYSPVDAQRSSFAASQQQQKISSITHQQSPVVASDKYTQSQAHMSLPEIKKLIAQTYDIKKYDSIVSAALAQEEKYKDYYVFYHGSDSVWRLAQDVYTQLYAHYYPEKLDKSAKDFVFLRFGGGFPAINPQEFLLTELKKNGLINDHGKMGEKLLAVNLALFGNVGVPSECSWEYFIKSRGHANPNRSTYEQIMNFFGVTHKYINELLSLVKLYETKEQMLIQIFIPKHLVDTIGYLAWIRGIPADEEIMEWVLASVRSKRYPKTQQSLDALTALFKIEQEKDPMFKRMIEEVKEGKFSLRQFLHVYRNNPERIEHINRMMARFIFTSSVLLNPQAGIKIFRYSTASPAQMQRYHEQLNSILNRIISDKTTS